MNEDLQAKFVAFLEAVESQASTAGQFVAEQTPLVAQEYLAWMFWGGCLMALAALVPLFIGGFLLRLFFQDPDDLNSPFFFAFGLLGAMAGMIFLAAGVHQAVKVSVAPRVVLLEKVAEIAK